jgi:hypothetical protein
MIHTVRNEIANYVTGLINAGPAAGKLVFQDVQGKTVATLTFADPAFAPATNGLATANAITPDFNALGGTINKAVAQDSTGKSVFTCTVTATGGAGDIQLSGLAVAVGQQVSLSTLAYVAPP